MKTLVKILAAAMMTAQTVSCAPQKIAIAAHRGFWDCEEAGYAENSIKSLEIAQRNKLWGSEFDVQMTSDLVLMVYHDVEIEGKRISEHKYADFKDYRLKNGERIPTLDEYLAQGAKSKTVMVLEIKRAVNLPNEDYLIDQCVKSLKDHKLFKPKRVVFLSGNMSVCEKLAARCPGFTVQYIRYDKSPAEVAGHGVNGVAYPRKTFKKHPTWIKEARDNKMNVNCWAAKTEKDAQNMIDIGVDCITTNDPLLIREKLGKRERRR